MNDNLLIVNFSKFKSQEENYTTEAFASLLRYLVRSEREFSFGLFNLLTQHKFNSMEFEPNEIIIRTQTATDSGRPDIEISAPDFLIYIENKLEARLERNQVERYKSVLNNSGNSSALLIVISKYRMKFQEEPDFYIRWFQIATWLDKEINRLKSDESFTKVSHFLEFLCCRYLAAESANVRVSPPLKKYLQRQGRDSLSFRPMKRSSDLKDDPDLIPLRKLLNVMAFAIEKTFPNDSFGFFNRRSWGSKQEYTSIGFNIEFRYDFFIDIDSADIVWFRAAIRRNSIRNDSIRRKLNPPPELGHGKILKVDRFVYWTAKTKLTDKEVSFFSKSFDEQIIILGNFINKSRKIIDKLDT